jgi:hypothetical protein
MSEADAAHGSFASFLAAPADLGANLAMGVTIRMLFAFFRAKATGDGAGFEHRPEQFFVGAGSPRSDRAGRKAHIRAIEIETDALFQPLDMVFPEAGVGAGKAGLAAIVAFLDAANERVVHPAVHVRMRADDVLNMHESPSRVS